jgi:hypothetical protein
LSMEFDVSNLIILPVDLNIDHFPLPSSLLAYAYLPNAILAASGLQ